MPVPAASYYFRSQVAGFVLLFLLVPGLAGSSEFGVVYTSEIWSNTSGGIETGTRYLDNLDLELEIDVADAWGIGAGTLFVHGLYNNGTTFSDELVGDMQTVSNVEAVEAARLFEFWYELAEDQWSVRTGLYDLNSEFDVNETGALFTNSSHGIGAELGQTGLNGPSIFPVSSLALRGAIQTDSVTARVAIIDAVPGDADDPASNEIRLDDDEGVLTIAELDVPLRESSRLWAGYWRYSAAFEKPFDSGFDNGNDGWYVGFEQMFHLGSRSMAWFVRYGEANEQLNALADYLGAGVLINGLFTGRPEDQIGLAVASAGAGDPYRDSLVQTGVGAERRETALEMTYRAAINEHLVIQPDIQYVRNPSSSSALDNAWVFGLRLEIAY